MLVLVDSVVNSGATVLQFVKHVRSLNTAIRIVVVTGVAQGHAINSGGVPYALSKYRKMSIVTLRLSDNKFAGRGICRGTSRLSAPL